MLKQRVLDTIKKNELISYGDGIVVGISGGYDSVCLLHILYSIAEEYSLKLYPVHINHMLRGHEAKRDEEFVKAFCSELGLDALTVSVDIAEKAAQEKVSLEEAGRIVRYHVFNQVVKEKSANKIAVAHSKNDQAETLLMRIFRGTGPEGLKGIDYKRDNIIRPLLDADRAHIEEYVRDSGLTAITDSSNLQTDYFRNRVRLKVIPEINRAVGTDITENLLRLSKILVADEDFLRYNSELYYQKAVLNKRKSFIELGLKELAQLHRAICSRVLRQAFIEVSGSITGLEYVHVEKLIQLVLNGRTGAGLDLPMGLKALKSYDSITIQKRLDEKPEKFEYGLRMSGDTEVNIYNSIIRSQIYNFNSSDQCRSFIIGQEDKQKKFFDLETIQTRLDMNSNFRLVVRNRRDGDIFKPLKANGTKKLKEYFIDNKIPKSQRDSLPLIAINKEIIWIVGNKTSDNYKVTDNTKTVLMITYLQLD